MINIITALRKLAMGETDETFRVTTRKYELSGDLNDREATILLRDMICRECVLRGYNESPEEDFVIPYDVEVVS